MEQVADNTYLIDVLHAKPGGTCAYLITGNDNNDCALIDCGGKNGEGQILAALDELHIPATAVKWLFITHAHLDHSGCAGRLMRQLPNAICAGHPSAVKHLANPQLKLARAVRGLYGGEFYDREYGELLPMEESRIRPLKDGESITLNTKTLRAIYTPGHAWHHLSIVDDSGGIVFAGDSFGVSYGNDGGGEAVVMPVMPPTQFNPAAMRESVRLQSALPVKFFALTHYGLIANTPQAAAQQLRVMDKWQSLAAQTEDAICKSGEDFRAVFEPKLREMVREDLSARGLQTEMIERYANDVKLTAAGFTHLRKTKTGINND